MKRISRSRIVSAWNRQPYNVAGGRLLSAFRVSQPALSRWLLACHAQFEQETEDSQLLPLANLAYKLLSAGASLKPVRTKAIEKCFASNEEFILSLEDLSEREYACRTRRLLTDYAQAPLLSFCLDVLFVDGQAPFDAVSDRIGTELLWLKTLIDCLDQ
jgi:hypothetical protein